MAYVLRYFMNYVDNASGLPVVVNIYYPDFDDSPLELIPADAPCTVSELNEAQNIFNPIRAKEFRLKFITDNLVYPGIIDFATNNDNDWKVDILMNGAIWLTGFILTDQISEGWYTDNTKHYIELVATDNLGTLKKLPLKAIDGSNYIPTEKQYLITLVKACLNQAISGLVLNIFDNLFEIGFNDRDSVVVTNFTTSISAVASTKTIIILIAPGNFKPGDTFTLTGTISNDGTYTVVALGVNPVFAEVEVLESVVDESSTSGVDIAISHLALEIDSYQQCMIDMRTFTVNYDTYEDAYTVLTKILESRSSVLFQHMGEWYIVRVCELFANETINGSKYNIDDTIEAIRDASWTSDLNESGNIIPVEQFMIKSFLNPVLSNKVIYNYENFDEFLCNELWKRGAIQIDTPTLKEYDVDCWTHFQGGVISTTPATVLFRRRDVIDAATEVVTESYVYLENQAPFLVSFARSEGAQVNKDDKISVSFSRRLKNGYMGAGNESLIHILLYANDGSLYCVDDDGLWYPGQGKVIQHSFSATDDRAVWRERTVDADYTPKSGRIFIHINEGSLSAFAGQESHFKDFKITYRSYLEGKTFVNVEGDFHKLTLGSSLKDTAEYQVYLSDSPKYLFKGALFQADGTTLTTLWYEMAYPLVQYPIKRFNAIAHYRMSNRNMLKVEGSFFKWVNGEPIISVQKITINNGDPNKRFLPAFFRDLDTSKSRFSSLLIEVLDPTKDFVTVTTTNDFELMGEFIATDTFEFDNGSATQDYFSVGDVVNISNTTNYTIGAAVSSVSNIGNIFTIVFTSVSFVNDVLTNPATFNNPSRPLTTTIIYPVDASHEFNYIFKAK